MEIQRKGLNRAFIVLAVVLRLLGLIHGGFSVDRFYLGYTALGIFKLLTAGGLGIWALIDFIRIGVDSLLPADGSPWVEIRQRGLQGGHVVTLIIQGHMKNDAGNEYQGLTIDGIGITVYATQYTHENDSESNQYDKDAAM